jgi:hypothetical protein
MRSRLLESAKEQQQMADLIRSILLGSSIVEPANPGREMREVYSG